MHHDSGAGRGAAGAEVVLGVDIGTTSSKGVLVGLDGRILAESTREHQVERPANGQVEMSAGLWWDELRGIVADLLAACPDCHVVAVGPSGMGPCVLLTDAAGEPLRPAILYGVDTRATAQIAQLNDRYTDREIRARVGSSLSTQAVGPKLLWLAQHEPEVFARARRLFMPSSYLVFLLTGEYVLDHHSASQSDPLYDMASGAWYQPWWSDIAGRVDAPDLCWPGEVAGTLTAWAAEQTGLPAGIPVVAGTVDAWAEGVSAGAHRVGDLMLMYGTTMFLIDTVGSMVAAPSLWSTVGVDPGTHCLAAGMATSGAITGWLNDVFGRPGYQDLLTEAASSPPGSNGLLMLPYFAGERTPIADPDARGVLAGLTLSHTRGDLYRAALEGTAFGVRHNIEAMRAGGGTIDRVVAVGGGTQGGLWTQIVSDATGLPQQLPRYTVGASYGMAFLAARSQLPVRIDEWNPVQRTVQPDPAAGAALAARYRDYLDLYPATADIVHHLASDQRHANVAPTAHPDTQQRKVNNP